MEAVCTSETSVDNHFTRQYNPEDSSEHHTRRRENLKSDIVVLSHTSTGPVVHSATDIATPERVTFIVVWQYQMPLLSKLALYETIPFSHNAD
jgi:hypothetical protein